MTKKLEADELKFHNYVVDLIHEKKPIDKG
jgi:hypothetical protein